MGNGSTNSTTRSIRVPTPTLHDGEALRIDFDPAAGTRAEAEVKQTRPTTTEQPILLFGQIEQALKVLRHDLEDLPRSSANYDNRLRAMLSTTARMHAAIRQLISASAQHLDQEL